MLIAAQALRLSQVEGSNPSYFMRRFCTTSDTCRHKIGNTLGGERKACTLNAKGTTATNDRKEAVKN